MSTVDQLRRSTDTRDHVLLTLVEQLNAGTMTSSTAAGVADYIRGAPAEEVSRCLHHLALLGALDERRDLSGRCIYLLNNAGAELLLSEVGGWEPSKREQERRDREIAHALANPRRSR